MSSVKQRRYLNVCEYGSNNEIFDLGLVYIPSRFGAIDLVDIKDMQSKLRRTYVCMHNQNHLC